MKNKKFTLIELMVVIAIIGILASLLLPVLGKARKKAIAIQCVNNLKQILIATAMYNEDNGDTFPIRGGGISYDDLLAGYDGRNSLSQEIMDQDGELTIENTGGSTAIYKCPTSPSLEYPERSYGISLRGNGKQKKYYGIAGSTDRGSLISSHIDRPSKVIAYGERYKMGDQDAKTYTMGDDGQDVTSAHHMDKDTDGAEYHQKKSNYGMVDGHIEKRNQLSTLVRLDGSGVTDKNDVGGTIWDSGIP